MNASIFVKQYVNGKEIVHFIVKRELPRYKNIVILSATADEGIYRRVFGDRMVFHDIGPVDMVGKIIQYPEYSFSRDKLANSSYYASLARLAAGEKPVITYKEYLNHFPQAIGHFGALRGIDSFNSNELVIMGTPNLPPEAYYLLAAALGISMKKNELNLTYTKVKRNDIGFWFHTFSKNRELQDLQLYKVESELIQAVHRARPVRRKSIIEIYANYPVIGAKYEFIDQNYKKLARLEAA